MRLPFQPFTTQDVPQYAVARPQQMPQMPQPIGPSPETASMFARQLESLGQTIIESTAQIAKPYVVDANEAERERKRAELATKNKIVLDFEGSLAPYEKAALRSTQINPRAYKEKNYAKEFKSRTAPFLAKALRDYGIEPESTLAKEIENSLVASAQERARSLDRSDVAAIANQILQADQEAEDAAFRSLDYYYIRKVEEIASEKAKSGLELTPEDYDEAYAYAYNEAIKSVNQISDQERKKIVLDKLVTVGEGRTNQQKIEHHSTLVQRKEREEAEQDASNINDAAIAIQVELDKKISELPDDPNSEISAQEAFGDYLNKDGTPNKEAIEKLIDSKKITFLNPETSRVRAIAEMASIVQRFASARNRADYETKKQNFVETQNRAKLDAIAEADERAEAKGLIEQLENSPFRGIQISYQYYDIAREVAKEFGGGDDQLVADIERSINAHFRTDRRAAIGSAAKYDSTGKELDFLERFNNLLENKEYSLPEDFYRDPDTGERVKTPIGFKPYVEYLLRRAEEDPDNYPLVDVLKLIDDRREQTRDQLEAFATELFGDDLQSIQRVMINVDKDLNGIDADAEKKLVIASKANEEALNNVSRSLAVNTAIDRVFLELKEQELTPSQAVSKFDELISAALDEATKGMSTLDAALFRNEFGDSTRAKRISLQEDALRETQKETRASAINLLDNQLREDGPWTDEEYLFKKESVTATISKLVFLTEEEQAALQAERMKLLDTADARMMVKTDPESALNLLRPQANGKYSKDRFAFIDPSVRNSLISTAEAVLNSGASVSQKQKQLKNAIGTALEAMNPLEQNGGMLNIDPSILELAKGLDEADHDDVVLEFEFLKQLGEAVGTDLTLSEKLAGMPDADLDKFSSQFSHIRFQKEEGFGDSRILEKYSDALNALIKTIKTERNRNPSRHHWRRLRATSGNESASYFDSEAQRAVTANQILLNPNLEEVRVLDNEFVDLSKNVWANGVPSGTREWDTKTFTSEQNIIDIRKQMANEMLKSPRAMQELVQNGVTSYVELQMYVEMSGSELYAITRGAEGGKAETNRKILEASGEERQVYADTFIFQNEEIAKIVSSYDFEDQEDLKLMIRQYIAGQEEPDFEKRIVNAAKAFSLGSKYAIANVAEDAFQGTVKLPSEFDVSRTGSVLSDSRHVKDLIKNLIVFGANGEPTKVDATAVFVGYVESNQPWRWSNVTSAAGKEVEALAIEILDNNGVYQKIAMNGKIPVLTFQQLEKYMSSKDRNISFDEDIIEAAKQVGARLTKLDDMEEFNKIMRDLARGGAGRKPTAEEVTLINKKWDEIFRSYPEYAIEMYENAAEWFKKQIEAKHKFRSKELNEAQ